MTVGSSSGKKSKNQKRLIGGEYSTRTVRYCTRLVTEMASKIACDSPNHAWMCRRSCSLYDNLAYIMIKDIGMLLHTLHSKHSKTVKSFKNRYYGLHFFPKCLPKCLQITKELLTASSCNVVRLKLKTVSGVASHSSLGNFLASLDTEF